jgi:hypothetical protein
MDQTINERWLQFGYLNAKGNVVKTALKIPFHTDLKVDGNVHVEIAGKNYDLPVFVKKPCLTTAIR